MEFGILGPLAVWRVVGEERELALLSEAWGRVQSHRPRDVLACRKLQHVATAEVRAASTFGGPVPGTFASGAARFVLIFRAR
jgi:hypothetical protein